MGAVTIASVRIFQAPCRSGSAVGYGECALAGSNSRSMRQIECGGRMGEAPTLMRSTPVWAMPPRCASVTPPEASSWTLGRRRSRRLTASARHSGPRLSTRMISGPHPRARSSCSSESTSISMIVPGGVFARAARLPRRSGQGCTSRAAVRSQAR